ncbi:hypothetical protein GCM10010971_18290 [Silvimonas amylolytica]|uniref:Uncharacterized protein n=1 Tax=Silvimonas amylolytica TaxID=449663 RepID=A0ABQ2PLA6_9NEIS|nr:hypothetical protein GCM10010971_18290 [Silvimonas amylolytica]
MQKKLFGWKQIFGVQASRNEDECTRPAGAKIGQREEITALQSQGHAQSISWLDRAGYVSICRENRRGESEAQRLAFCSGAMAE